MNIYTLNIYKPGSKEEPVARFTSGSPFHPFVVGDLLQPTESLNFDQIVKVASVEHNMFQTEKQGGYNDGLRHEINVYTTDCLS